MWTVVGQERTVLALRAALDRGSLSHSLLLVGPQGTGKTALALELAMALNCVGDDPPCHACVHCRQIAAGTHPDVVFFEKAEGKQNIVIEQVRELRDATSLRAFQGTEKVYVVAGAEFLTAQASDALLKTLEEPQNGVTVILTATDLDAIPSTIVSRCRLFTLAPVPAPAIAQALLGTGQDPSDAARLARLARGNLGWAVRAAENPRLASQAEEMVTQLVGLFGAPLETRLALAESIAVDKKDRAAGRRALETLAAIARDLLRLGRGLPAEYVTGPAEVALQREAARISVAEVFAFFELLRHTMQRIDSNVDPRLALEALFIETP